MTFETVLLALLVFALVATRPMEERRWRDGRISDARAALLVAGRLSLLVIGFALVTARPPEVTLLMAGVACAVAALVHPLVTRRLRHVRRRG